MSLSVLLCDVFGCVLLITLEIQYRLSLYSTKNFMLMLVALASSNFFQDLDFF